MAEIAGALVKMLIEELDQNSSNSEGVQTKLGANINALIDLKKNLYVDAFASTSLWVCPAGVGTALIIGVGGGGGGAEGGYFTPAGLVHNPGANGSAGGPTLFNGNLIANGGGGANGRGAPGGGGTSGRMSLGTLMAGGSGGGVFWAGVEYGAGGTGGGWVSSPPSGTIPTACGGGGGNLGFRAFTVTPATSYSVTIGGGGSGNDGLTNASGGGAGSSGLLLVIYVKSGP